jgi:tetratricopeptide (TPR) repeat protein
MRTALAVLLLALPLSSAVGRQGGYAVQSLPKPARCDGLWADDPATAPPGEAGRELEAKLAEARAEYEKRPEDADAIIWLGRRTAYLGRYMKAVEVFSEGVRKHPRDARMYRHRGHRYITLRCFDDAVKDLERAAQLVRGRADEVEPDGLPNARNTPTSTLKTNIFYHLGLAHYLKGDFARARTAFRECVKFSKNPDMLAAASHWLYMTLRRMKRDEEARRVLAAVDDEAELIENHDYRRLLLMYKGKTPPERLLEEAAATGARTLGYATTAYGVGAWHAYHGRPEKAAQVLLEVMSTGQRNSFGYIAAEADLRRMGISPPPALTEKTFRD